MARRSQDDHLPSVSEWTEDRGKRWEERHRLGIVLRPTVGDEDISGLSRSAMCSFPQIVVDVLLVVSPEAADEAVPPDRIAVPPLPACRPPPACPPVCSPASSGQVVQSSRRWCLFYLAGVRWDQAHRVSGRGALGDRSSPDARHGSACPPVCVPTSAAPRHRPPSGDSTCATSCVVVCVRRLC